MMRSSASSRGLLRNGQQKRKDGFKNSSRAKKKSKVDHTVPIPVIVNIKRRKASMGDLPVFANKENLVPIIFNTTPYRPGRRLKKYFPIPTALFIQDLVLALPFIARSGPSIFDALPLESILLIFSFVTDRKDVLNLRNCSRSCNTLLSDRSLRRSLYSEDLDRENEEFYKVPCDYMINVQQGITPAMRAVLVEWLIEVADEFHFHPETLFACVNHIDRFLCLRPVAKSRLQLLGSTAMWIASKYEEIRSPRVDDFVILSDNLYNKLEIINMESNILSTLGFHISAVTPRIFITKYTSYIPLSDIRITHLSNFILELVLLDYEASRMTASLVAASALSVALHVLGYTPWTHLMEILTQLSPTDAEMRRCIDYLYELLGRSRTARYVHDKYCQEEFSAVALLQRPVEPFGDVAPMFLVVRSL